MEPPPKLEAPVLEAVDAEKIHVKLTSVTCQLPISAYAVYIYIYIYLYICVYIQIYTHISLSIYIYICVHMCV